MSDSWTSCEISLQWGILLSWDYQILSELVFQCWFSKVQLFPILQQIGWKYIKIVLKVHQVSFATDWCPLWNGVWRQAEIGPTESTAVSRGQHCIRKNYQQVICSNIRRFVNIGNFTSRFTGIFVRFLRLI